MDLNFTSKTSPQYSLLEKALSSDDYKRINAGIDTRFLLLIQGLRPKWRGQQLLCILIPNKLCPLKCQRSAFGRMLENFDATEGTSKRGLMLLYMHDDTESLEDSFTVQLTDGKRTVQGTLYIYIMPVNNEIPHLSRPFKRSLRGTGEKPSVRLIRQCPLCVVMFWKLKQLRKAISSAGSEAETTDAAEDELTAQSNSPHMPRFVAEGDIVLLAKPVTLTEGDRVTLTTDVPVATDGTSKPEKLLYAVSLPPVHGQIEHINYPGVPISSYRQLDVVAQKVSYVHDNSHGAVGAIFNDQYGCGDETAANSNMM
ncbi:hypothetical protein Q9966_002995 [Columba livia]|nr:hypothetical protein Q9966_002995 [Columba livia]